MNAPASPLPHPGTRFRQRLARPGLIRSLGAFDTFSGLLMEQAGLEMIFLGGFGVSASLPRPGTVQLLICSAMRLR